jgi:hypothetical protein
VIEDFALSHNHSLLSFHIPCDFVVVLLRLVLPNAAKRWRKREKPSLHRHKVGGGGKNGGGISGAKSALHRHKVGGGEEFLSKKQEDGE